MKNITLLGIDPGYDRLGWCVLHISGQKNQIIASGCIETNKSDTIFARYLAIDTELSTMIKTYHPTECGIETLFFTKNAKTVMKVSEVRGVVISCLLRRGIEVFDYTPMQIKSAITGNGRAGKPEVEQMITLLTRCEKLPKLDDEVDAIATALCHGVSRAVRVRTRSL
ncbi:MAG: crossover junction endodeoxyribonuclease RuvC [Candidatus Pacebacteria bacterium]|nr:crossover junction endodeoxyribonuclease RuvC [Candidatus Paceibacterota bacterium]